MIRYDGLNKYEVYIESQEVVNNELIGRPHRRMFRNTEKDRIELESYIPKEIYEEILEVWGNDPLKPEDFF